MLRDPTMTVWVYTLLVFAGGVGAVGDAFLNHWVKTNKGVWLAASLILWIAAVSCFAWLLKCERFAFGAAVVLGLLVHATLAVVLDRFYFGGRFTLWQCMGFLCALAAIVLISQGSTSVAANISAAIDTSQQATAKEGR